MEIRPYTRELESAVKALNARLRAGGEKYWAFPESHVPRYPKLADCGPYQELFLAYDNGQVRGGYVLTHNRIAINGDITWVTCGPQLNLSEGIVNRSYVMTGVINVRDAVRRQPYLYGLGLGGLHEPMAKLLVSMKWSLQFVPFYFKVLSSRFFANISYLRKIPSGRIMMDLMRYSGMGWVGVRVAQFRPWVQEPVTVDVCEEFDEWADDLWSRCKTRYSMIAARDSLTLNRLYPPDFDCFRLRISRGERLLGWVVVRDTQMTAHKQFGNMRVGSIVDCLAEPEDAGSVVRCGTEFLDKRGIDLLVSNQSSSAWRKALVAAGFLKGPSNFILAMSPKLAARLEPLADSFPKMHLNRGDGDGPVHL